MGQKIKLAIYLRARPKNRSLSFSDSTVDF